MTTGWAALVAFCKTGWVASVSDALTDPDRLAALRRLVLLDSPPRATFDRLTHLAAQLLEAPLAMVSLVEADRQFFLSACGLPEPIRTMRQTTLDLSICQHVVATGRPVIAADTRHDPLLAGSGAVAALGIVAYAGLPLVTPEGHAVGCLSVADVVPRDWTGHQLTILAHLADITVDEMRLHFLDRVVARRRGAWRGDGSVRPPAGELA
jgi:GAF domain-containing protein